MRDYFCLKMFIFKEFVANSKEIINSFDIFNERKVLTFEISYFKMLSVLLFKKILKCSFTASLSDRKAEGRFNLFVTTPFQSFNYLHKKEGKTEEEENVCEFFCALRS